MKLCDEKIQKHLLSGGKIKRKSDNFPVFLNEYGNMCYQDMYYTINKNDLTTDDWEIVVPEYNWDKIIKDKVLCVFSDYEDYKEEVISVLISKDKDTDFYINSQGFQYKYCKPFNSADYSNIAKDIKEYEI